MLCLAESPANGCGHVAALLTHMHADASVVRARGTSERHTGVGSRTDTGANFSPHNGTAVRCRCRHACNISTSSGSIGDTRWRLRTRQDPQHAAFVLPGYPNKNKRCQPTHLLWNVRPADRRQNAWRGPTHRKHARRRQGQAVKRDSCKGPLSQPLAVWAAAAPRDPPKVVFATATISPSSIKIAMTASTRTDDSKRLVWWQQQVRGAN